MHDVPHIELVYEDDLMDPNIYPDTARRLSSYLEIENIKPAGSALKLVHQQLADIVTNYEEVIAGIEASDYAYLLTSNRYLLTV